MVARRRPPKVVGRCSRKRSETPPVRRFRHAPWALATLACVVFAVLIAGVAGLRQVVILVSDSRTTSITAEPETGVTLPVEGAAPESAIESLESSEPELEVLPPTAAQQPGRTLPRMLIVGRQPEMFPSLGEAMAAAIGGDVIEIRDNGPLSLEPGEAVWNGEEGTLTIRAGQGFQPVLTRRRGAAGHLLEFGGYGPQLNMKVVVWNLAFVDSTPANVSGSGVIHCPILARCALDVQHCFFASNNAAILASGVTADTQYSVEDCSFLALRELDRWTVCQGIVINRGKLTCQNNLFVGVERVLNIGGGLDRNLPPQSQIDFQHNTLLLWGGTYFLYAKTNLQSSNNLFAIQRGLDNGPYGFGWGSHVESFEAAQDRLAYSGTANLFHQVKWAVWQGHGSDDFAGWQRLTRDGEQSPLFADPLFANPDLPGLVTGRVLPPAAFGLRPDSPAKGAATDGGDIGCDVSRIATPPPIVERLITDMLQPTPPMTQ